MKFLRPRSADSGLVTVLLVSNDELSMLLESTAIKIRQLPPEPETQVAWKKLKAELETARKAL